MIGRIETEVERKERSSTRYGYDLCRCALCLSSPVSCERTGGGRTAARVLDVISAKTSPLPDGDGPQQWRSSATQPSNLLSRANQPQLKKPVWKRRAAGTRRYLETRFNPADRLMIPSKITCGYQQHEPPPHDQVTRPPYRMVRRGQRPSSAGCETECASEGGARRPGKFLCAGVLATRAIGAARDARINEPPPSQAGTLASPWSVAVKPTRDAPSQGGLTRREGRGLDRQPFA